MNENLDLTEILKDCRRDTKLWSPVCGECMFQYIDITIDFPIVCLVVDKYGEKTQVLFTKYGCIYSTFTYSECVLFPSKDNRDWSTFNAPWKHKHFEPFQKVLVKILHDSRSIWVADFYSHYDEITGRYYLVSGLTREDDEVIPYDGNEDKLGKPVD